MVQWSNLRLLLLDQQIMVQSGGRLKLSNPAYGKLIKKKWLSEDKERRAVDVR